MKLNHIIVMQQVIELLESILDVTPQEVIDCLSQRLISKKDADQILESLK